MQKGAFLERALVTSQWPSNPELVSSPDALSADPSLAAQYVARLVKSGPGNLISNVASKPMLCRYQDLRLPVTVEDGTLGHSYVISPHSNYVLYARDEIDILDLRFGRTLAIGTLSVLDAVLRLLDVNKTVHLDNWILSTSLHGDWHGQGLPEIRDLLTRQFPDHLPVIRSLDQWSCPELMHAAKDDGWLLMPARQIWVTNDLRRDWKKRNNTQNDRRALKKSDFVVRQPETLAVEEARRIAELYRALYVGRYSAINPIFTPEFVQNAAETGLLQFKLVCAPDGEIVAACGMRQAGGIGTVPFLGYDLDRPQSDGLYRIACYLASEWAMELGLRFNGSAGAAQFKTMRGARGQIEYMAVYVGHLSAKRRMGIQLLSAALNSVMVPMLKKQAW
ncbi:MAG: hypothetical protein AAFY42_08210 [Pseudomonadota bacterium]